MGAGEEAGKNHNTHCNKNNWISVETREQLRDLSVCSYSIKFVKDFKMLEINGAIEGSRSTDVFVQEYGHFRTGVQTFPYRSTDVFILKYEHFRTPIPEFVISTLQTFTF